MHFIVDDIYYYYYYVLLLLNNIKNVIFLHTKQKIAKKIKKNPSNSFFTLSC